MPEKSDTKRIIEFFGMTAGEMIKEWKLLTDEDKKQIREGILNGSLTY